MWCYFFLDDHYIQFGLVLWIAYKKPFEGLGSGFLPPKCDIEAVLKYYHSVFLLMTVVSFIY